jgi:putative phosphoserine phosphatase/1-acylglycerol-3-phosphate O-acyltransferase
MNKVAALFDMDRTLLDTSSALLYVRYLRRIGQIERRRVAKVIGWTLLERLGLLDMQRLVERLVTATSGDSEPELKCLCDRWFAEDVLAHVTDRGRQRLAEHQARGHILGIVSASTQYAVGPLAAHLGIPGQYVSTHLESQDGRLTGQVVPPLCYGEGKVVWAERFAAEHDADLPASYFYTDSITELSCQIARLRCRPTRRLS